MKKLLFLFVAALVAGVVFAQEAAPKKVAVFVQNRTRVPGMNEEIASIRDRLTAAMAATGEIEAVASDLAVEPTPSSAAMLGCDYIAVGAVVGATSTSRNIGGRLSKVYTLRMTLKVTDASGKSVFAMAPWTRQYPVVNAADDAMTYYNLLIDSWSEEAGTAVANSAAKWRDAKASEAALATVSITTTIDETIAELESQTKGASGETLVDLRRVCGGATIEVDGAVIGSAPGDFRLSSGLHSIKVSREWMKPYAATINVTDGMVLKVALEMSEEGLAKWGSTEALRAELARRYAEAAMVRGIKLNVNHDTSGWRDVSAGNVPTVNFKQN